MWINVKDKLPKDLEKEQPTKFCQSEGLLLIIKTRSCPSPLIGIGQCNNDETWMVVSNAGYYSCTGLWEFTDFEITHWMPLPDKPI
jgi:hypothetical protein